MTIVSRSVFSEIFFFLVSLNVLADTHVLLFQSPGGEHSFHVQPLSLPHCPKGLGEKQLNGEIFLIDHRLLVVATQMLLLTAIKNISSHLNCFKVQFDLSINFPFLFKLKELTEYHSYATY